MALQPFPTDNNGSTYFNVNRCHNGNVTLNSTTYTALSNIVCGEVIISSNAQDLYIIQDNAPTEPFLIKANTSGGQHFFTFRGLTNANQLSARSGADSPIMYYRTQSYSNNPSR